MDPSHAFAQVESLYRQILALTLRQEACLSAGEFEALPGIAGEQMDLLAQADVLMSAIGHVAGREDPAFQIGIHKLAAVLSEVVASEERCKALAPPSAQSAQPPPARVLAAYGKR